MKTKLFFSMLVMAVMALFGCSEDQTALQVNYENTGIVKGKVVFVEESGRERIGAGVTVYADIPYSTLGDDSSLDGDKHFETQTDGNGLFSLELPVGNGKTTLLGIIIKTQQVSLENESGYYEAAISSVVQISKGVTTYLQNTLKMDYVELDWTLNNSTSGNNSGTSGNE